MYTSRYITKYLNIGYKQLSRYIYLETNVLTLDDINKLIEALLNKRNNSSLIKARKLQRLLKIEEEI